MIRVIRTLAKSWKYQTLLAASKNFSLNLFGDIKNFNKLQLLFLHWNSVYNTLLEELAMGEEYLNEDILKDDMRVDAYLYFKSQRIKDQKKNKSFYKQFHNKQQVDMNQPGAFEFQILSPDKKQKVEVK